MSTTTQTTPNYLGIYVPRDDADFDLYLVATQQLIDENPEWVQHFENEGAKLIPFDSLDECVGVWSENPV